MKMTSVVRAALFAATAIGIATGAQARNPNVGGAPMFETKNIVENAVNSKDHTTLVAAVKAAGLVDTLASAGPFTVFAPTNAAFAKLPKGTVQTVLQPENKPTLVKILTYHVVPGTYSAAQLADLAKQGGSLKTVEGDSLRFVAKGRAIYVVDDKGMSARVTIPNVVQSNGVIHVVNAVLMP